MINVMSPLSKESVMEAENCLDPQLWHACAGSMVQMLAKHSTVIYFPQGHIEHCQSNIDYKGLPKLPPLIPCRISSIKYLADRETDEVCARVRLVPLSGKELQGCCDVGSENKGQSGGSEKPASFAKTLTQSDANNGGGFSVPRYCAETIFPRLDYSAEPPVQTILAKDVHGVTWKFRHIYRGTPRRHLLTTGWSNFVNQKKLVAGDSIVFLRGDNGDLYFGVRRARRGIGYGPESSGGWNANCGSSPYNGYSSFSRDDERNRMLRAFNGLGGGAKNGSSQLKGGSVVEAAKLAANGQPFEVVYYPRASTPEFCVKASVVEVAMQVHWCSGMRFKMAFETEDSRISWFMGTVSSVQVADPFRWPNSPWRLLQVSWDEPDLLQNVKRVNPWLVEPVATMPVIHMSPFFPPRKKLRLPQTQDFPPYLDHLPLIPPFTTNTFRLSNPLLVAPKNIPAGIQGARHPHLGQLLSDPRTSKLHSVLFGAPTRFSGHSFMFKPETEDDISCLLTVGNRRNTGKNNDDVKMAPKFMLFGKPILTQEQISQSSSSRESLGNYSLAYDNMEKTANNPDASHGPVNSTSEEVYGGNGVDGLKTEFGSDHAGHCKVFVQSDHVGRTLDLSVWGRSEVQSNVLYKDWIGTTKQTGDKPLSEFLKTTRGLRILTDVNADNLAR